MRAGKLVEYRLSIGFAADWSILVEYVDLQPTKRGADLQHPEHSETQNNIPPRTIQTAIRWDLKEEFRASNYVGICVRQFVW